MNIQNAVKKTIAYARRNGIRAAASAAIERLQAEGELYTYVVLEADALEEQRGRYQSYLAEQRKLPRISIIVPCYNTPVSFFQEMVESVQAQSYGNWELILADASREADLGRRTASLAKGDARIVYQHLDHNGGISENTNAALELATGDYIGLLDHDDLLTPDAICEVTERILACSKAPTLVYSDEDKCDGAPLRYFEPNRKPDFNLDYLLSNNYISHFSVFSAESIRALQYRNTYDGAQDYDMLLRVCGRALQAGGAAGAEDIPLIVHIPRVLYHWRCHEGSTAANPESKRYAYEAGRRAVADFLTGEGIAASVTESSHLGFYRTRYGTGDDDELASVLRERPDIGVAGGTLTDRLGRIAGGNYTQEGAVQYKGLSKENSGGFTHRAHCQQDVESVDLRFCTVRAELLPMLQACVDKGRLSYEIQGDILIPQLVGKWTGEEVVEVSVRFCQMVWQAGYRILWDPYLRRRLGR